MRSADGMAMINILHMSTQPSTRFSTPLKASGLDMAVRRLTTRYKLSFNHTVD